jgi:hypothetical protein
MHAVDIAFAGYTGVCVCAEAMRMCRRMCVDAWSQGGRGLHMGESLGDRTWWSVCVSLYVCRAAKQATWLTRHADGHTPACNPLPLVPPPPTGVMVGPVNGHFCMLPSHIITQSAR